MSVLYKGFFYAVETMVFAYIMILLYIAIDRNAEYERMVNLSVNDKINISSTYTEMEDETAYADPDGGGSLLFLSGGAVLAELLTYDGSITVQVNSTVLNHYRTQTGEPFFEYVEKYGLPGDVAKQISSSRQYRKTCVTDNEGWLVKVQYILQ